MISCRSLSKLSLDEVYDAVEDAFSDYFVKFTRVDVEKKLKRCGFDPNISFGVFEDNKLVSFALLGRGDYDGVLTAYDIMSGTVVKCRGKKFAGMCLNSALPVVMSLGCTQYLLEVVTINERALSVYRQVGFSIFREFSIFVQDLTKIDFVKWATNVEFRDIKADFDAEKAAAMWDFPPSWQNQLFSILLDKEGFVFLGAYLDGELIGYGIVESRNGSLAQLAVARDHRRKRVGTALLKELLSHVTGMQLRVINADARDEGLKGLFASLNVPLTLSQYEMTMKIDNPASQSCS